MLDESGEPVLIDFGLCKKYRSDSNEHVSEDDLLESFRGDI